MSAPASVETVASEADKDALAAILAQCFDVPLGALRAPLDRHELAEAVVVRVDGRVVGGCKIVSMGHWFGGRSVPTAGIAAVGIDPAARGRGAARALMDTLMRRFADDGVATSSLYPATSSLYRGSGYELAGSRFKISLPLLGLGVDDRELAVRVAEVGDQPAMEAVYTRYAREHAGMLDRGLYVWERARRPGGEAAHHYVVLAGDDVVGYVGFRHEAIPGYGYDLNVCDLAFTSPAAGRRLLGLLATHRSLSPRALFHGGPDHPLLALLPEQRGEVKLHLHWMLRLCNLPAAMAARGFPPGVELELHLDVADDVVPANNGRCVLRVADGAGQLEPGGDGRLALDVRGLASLYSGFRSPWQLAALGQARGARADLALAAAAFAGPAPWMDVMF